MSEASAKLFACEPARFKYREDGKASWWWLDVPPLLFRTWRPVCERCGWEVTWLGPPERRGELLVYRVKCSWCLELDGKGEEQLVHDEIVVDFPLRIGGTAAWWKQAYGVEV